MPGFDPLPRSLQSEVHRRERSFRYELGPKDLTLCFSAPLDFTIILVLAPDWVATLDFNFARLGDLSLVGFVLAWTVRLGDNPIGRM